MMGNYWTTYFKPSWWRYKIIERLVKCPECKGRGGRHYLSCTVWGFNKSH